MTTKTSPMNAQDAASAASRSAMATMPRARHPKARQYRNVRHHDRASRSEGSSRRYSISSGISFTLPFARVGGKGDQ